MLGCERPAAMTIGDLTGLLNVRQPELQLATRIGADARELEVMPIGIVRLGEAVRTKQRVADFHTITDRHILHAGTQTTRIPVEEIVDVDIVAAIVNTSGPDACSVPSWDVGRLQIRLRQTDVALVGTEGGDVIELVVQAGHDDAADGQTTVEFEQTHVGFQFRIYLALVAQAIFALGTGQFVANLRTLFAGTCPCSYITMKCKCICAIVTICRGCSCWADRADEDASHCQRVFCNFPHSNISPSFIFLNRYYEIYDLWASSTAAWIDSEVQI